MGTLGNGLSGENDEDALSVKEAELAMLRRHGADEEDLLVVQNPILLAVSMLRTAARPYACDEGLLWSFEAPWRGTS